MRVRFGHVLFSKPRLTGSWARFHHTDMANPINKTAHPFDKARLEALLNRRFFYAPAFEIYGGTNTTCALPRSSPTDPPTQASQVYTTTVPPGPLSKPTSSPNGVVTLSSTITCSNSIRRS